MKAKVAALVSFLAFWLCLLLPIGLATPAAAATFPCAIGPSDIAGLTFINPGPSGVSTDASTFALGGVLTRDNVSATTGLCNSLPSLSIRPLVGATPTATVGLVVASATAQGGWLVRNSSSEVRYLPPSPTFSGTDSFTIDNNNNTRVITVTVNVLPFDTTAPAPPVIAMPANGATTNDATPTIFGTAEADSTVDVYIDGSLAGSPTATGGNWSFTPGTALSDGAHTVYATATDAADNTSTPSTTNAFIVDTTPPPAPIVLTPANGSTTSDTTPTVSGTAEPLSTVTVSFDGIAVGTTSVDGAGNWSYTSTVLADGAHTVRATAADAAGNTSPASATNSFTILQPPTTGNVSATVVYASANNPITLALGGGAATSVTVATQATQGTATAAGTAITYTPNASYAGPDSFTYTATNSQGTSSSAMVNITVGAPTVLLGPPTLPDGAFGIAYSETAVASGGHSPYQYSISAGALPSGLALDPSSGVFSGTPTAIGTSNFTVRAQDSSTGPAAPFSDTQSYSVTIAAPTITLTSPSAGALPGATGGTAYSQSFGASGGQAPHSFSLASGTLPAGMTIDASGLSGTPTQAGTFNFSVSATDSSPAPGPFTSTTVSYSLTVAPPAITVSPGSLPAATTAAAYSETVSATGGTAPYSFDISAGSLPTGLNLSSTGVLSGTPTVAGPFSFTVRATDAHGFTGLTGYTITVADPVISVTTPAAGALPGATGGTAYSQSFGASGGQAPHSFSLASGTLPAGMAIDASGLSGTPTQAGTFNFSVSATDSSPAPGPFTSTTVSYSLTVAPPAITVNPGSLPAATTAAAYSETVSASGGTAPYSFDISAGTLPTGLNLSSTGILSGTPTVAGPYSFTIRATDAHGFTGTTGYSVTVVDPVITITTPAGALPDATGGTAYSASFTASGGQGSHSFALTSGALPPGMALSSAGVLSGTPTAAGPFSVTLTATDASPGPGGPFTSAPVTYTLQVNAPGIVVNPSSLPAAVTAATYSQTVTASGGTAPYTFSIGTGALPVGMSFSSAGVFSGTPTVAGPHTFTVVATDAHGFTGSRAYSVTVADPVIAITAPAGGALPVATGGVAYSQSFTASGGQGSHSFSVTTGSLPIGMSLSSAGVLSGTPTVAGTSTFTLTARDASPSPGPFTSAPVSYSLTVVAPVIAVSPGSLPAAVTAATYNQTITASGGTGPYSFSISTGALPVGMSLSSAGVFSGTPTVSGTHTFTVVATDAHGFTGSRAYSVLVADPVIAIDAPAGGALPGATGGVAYSQSFTASGGQGSHSFSVTTGSLPIGMSLNSAGVLSGTPTVAGTSTFTLTARDASPSPGPFTSAPVSYSLTVVAPTISIAPTTLPAAVSAVAYSQTISASGGTGPYSFSISTGALPVGMSFSSAGLFSGTPTVSGIHTFTVVATDAHGFTGSQAYSVTVVDPAVTVTAPAAGALPGATGGVVYSQSFTASGGQGSHSFALATGALPPGLSLSSAGVLSGTPTTAGSYSFSIAASDQSPAPGPFTSPAVGYVLVVNAPTVVVAPPPAGGLPQPRSGVAFSYAFSASGGIAPHRFTLASGTLPPGLTLSSSGVLSGEATAVGTYSFSVRSMDSSPSPGPFASAAIPFEMTVIEGDTEAPTFTSFPGNIVVEAIWPRSDAAASWAAPTATDNRPGVTVTQIAGPPSGSDFSLGTTTIAYEARDGANNTTQKSFTVSVTQAQPGRVTIVVNSVADGTFDFTSPERALNFSIRALSGTGTSNAIAVPAGRHDLTFATPAAFDVASATCSDPASTFDLSKRTGTLVVVAGANITCTLSANDISRTTDMVGSFLEARAQLIVANGPEVGRRIERLTGNYSNDGGVSGFGLGYSNGGLPFAVRLSENEASFRYSMRRSQAEQAVEARVAAAHDRGPQMQGDREGGHDGTNLPTMATALGAVERASPSPLDAIEGAEPGNSADPLSHPFDIWAEGKLARFSAAGGDGRFGILHGGLDYLVTSRLLVGLGVQLDWTDMDGNKNAKMDGTGYIVGPYVTARLTDRIYFDGRAGWGQSFNTVSPFGTYSDDLDATRWLISGALIGRFEIEQWTIEPTARLSYFKETSESYTDTLGFDIPEVEVETGTFEFGPRVSYEMELEDEQVIEPFASLEGIWTFKQENTATVVSESPGLAETGLRGRGEVGISFFGRAGPTVSTSAFYDGIGSDDFESWGGQIRISQSF